MGVELREITPDHEVDDAVMRHGTALQFSRVSPVAENHDAVGQFENFTETMGDVEDAQRRRER